MSAVQCSSVQQVTLVMIGLGYMAWWLTAYVCVSAKAMALLCGWGGISSCTLYNSTRHVHVYFFERNVGC